MNQVIPFDFESHAVRTVVLDETPWWVGKDVCDALGYMNPNKAMGDHCDGVTKRYPIVDTLGRTQEVRIINEPDVFRLIVNSRLPQARRFEKWLFEEALPQIRKTGGYGANARELAALRESLLFAKSESDTYRRLWLEDRKTVQRFENRNFLTWEDKREIFNLLINKYPLSKIQLITKKGYTRIKNFRDEIFNMNDEELDKFITAIKSVKRDGGTLGYPFSEALIAAARGRRYTGDDEPSESFGGPLEAPAGHEGAAHEV